MKQEWGEFRSFLVFLVHLQSLISESGTFSFLSALTTSHLDTVPAWAILLKASSTTPKTSSIFILLYWLTWGQNKLSERQTINVMRSLVTWQSFSPDYKRNALILQVATLQNGIQMFRQTDNVSFRSDFWKLLYDNLDSGWWFITKQKGYKRSNCLPHKS